MNKREVMNLVLSEEEYFDDKNRGYKTYTVNDTEYKLYGELTSRRLDGELFEEYKVRRIFIQAYNNKSGRMIWFSKNSDSMKWYALARKLGKDGGNTDKIAIIKEKAISTNMGTLDKKKLEKLIKEYEGTN